jgi:hypothetical protein
VYVVEPVPCQPNSDALVSHGLVRVDRLPSLGSLIPQGLQNLLAILKGSSMNIMSVLDLVGCISSPVDHSMNLILSSGIDVSQEPVAQDVSLNTEGKLELTILLEVHELGFRVLLCSRRSLENVGVIAPCWLSSCLVCFDRKLQNSDGTPESLNWLDQVALAELRRCRNISLEERVTEREDGAIFGDLWPISIKSIQLMNAIDLR